MALIHKRTEQFGLVRSAVLTVRNYTFQGVTYLGSSNMFAVLEKKTSASPFIWYLSIFNWGSTFKIERATLYSLSLQSSCNICNDGKYLYVLTERISIPTLIYIYVFTFKGELVRIISLIGVCTSTKGIAFNGKDLVIIDTIGGVQYLHTISKKGESIGKTAITNTTNTGLCYNGKDYWTNYQSMLASIAKKMEYNGTLVKPYNVVSPYTDCCSDGKYIYWVK